MCSRDLVPEDSALMKWHQGYLANHRVRLAHDLDIINREISKTDSILELGSVPLILTSALRRSGYKVIGCDIAPERYSTSIRSVGLDVIKCNIETENLPFSDGTFDALIFNESFEHLRINLIFTLSEILRVLKPKGMLTLSTPNLKSLDGIRNFLLNDRASSCSSSIFTEYKKLTDIGHMGHVREYTPTEVVGFLQNIGFEVAAIIYRGEYANRLKRTLSSLIPRLSPYVSYIATKPEGSRQIQAPEN
jgi:SAM-dependent methyltransferase